MISRGGHLVRRNAYVFVRTGVVFIQKNQIKKLAHIDVYSIPIKKKWIRKGS